MTGRPPRGSGRQGEQQAGSGCNGEEAPGFAGALDLESSVTLGCRQLGGKAVTWQPGEAPSSLWTRSVKCLSDPREVGESAGLGGVACGWTLGPAGGRSHPGAACSEERRRAGVRPSGAREVGEVGEDRRPSSEP